MSRSSVNKKSKRWDDGEREAMKLLGEFNAFSPNPGNTKAKITTTPGQNQSASSKKSSPVHAPVPQFQQSIR